jgi:hypothetical protein
MPQAKGPPFENASFIGHYTTQTYFVLPTTLAKNGMDRQNIHPWFLK